MSCYVALALPQHVIVAADSLRRIWGNSAGDPLAKPILLEDARKLHLVTETCWITGTGLSGFHPAAAEQVKAFLGLKQRNRKLSLEEMGKVAQLQEALLETHAEVLQQMEVLAKRMGESAMDPRSIPTELLLCALSAEGIPFLARFSSIGGFAPQLVTGSGHFAHSAFSADGLSPLDLHIREYLEVAVEQLSPLRPESMENAALHMIPALMAIIAKARPGWVSASGDLVVIGSSGSRWSLY